MTSVEMARDGTNEVLVEEIDLLQKDQLFQVQTAKKGNSELLTNTFVKILSNNHEL